MIRSMTGFGRKEGTLDGSTVAVEVRAVNHRYLDIQCRLPRGLSPLEEACKAAIQQQCRRGRIDVTISLSGERAGPKQVVVDQRLAKAYTTALRALQKDLRLSGKPDINLIAGFRDVITLTENPGGDTNLQKLALRSLTAALREMDRMRKREGEALVREIEAHLAKLEGARGEVARLAPQVSIDALARLKTRVQTLLGTSTVDETRLHQELAMLADRSDVSEEMARLASHCGQFREALLRAEPVGKTLDFLLQEMGREVNTIGAKANDAGITTLVVQMKTELEKIREQVQNIE